MCAFRQAHEKHDSVVDSGTLDVGSKGWFTAPVSRDIFARNRSPSPAERTRHRPKPDQLSCMRESISKPRGRPARRYRVGPSHFAGLISFHGAAEKTTDRVGLPVGRLSLGVRIRAQDPKLLEIPEDGSLCRFSRHGPRHAEGAGAD
jgi:hypothetical protein